MIFQLRVVIDRENLGAVQIVVSPLHSFIQNIPNSAHNQSKTFMLAVAQLFQTSLPQPQQQRPLQQQLVPAEPSMMIASPLNCEDYIRV